MDKIVYIPRILDLEANLKEKSIFLFGPRQTGKSFLIRHTLANYRTYNLLDHETYLKLSRNPSRMREEIRDGERVVIVDEVQKLPTLLNEIHLLIEEKGVHFLLTGSSARALRRGGTNLLGGRARMKSLHPFSSYELKERFDLERAVNFGLVPSIYLSSNPDEDLKTYVATYLREEIAAEGLTRNIPAFSRFLEVAALCSGKMINYTNISNDAQTARSTVQEYFQILKDTLLAYELPAWKKTVKRKPIGTSKFYFFDTGVARFLRHQNQIAMGSPEFGESFEAFIFHELKSYCGYRGIEKLNYWRSTSGYEVDFILDNRIAIEIKASKTIGKSDLKSIRALKEEKNLTHYILVCLETEQRTVDAIEILPWKTFLERLWSNTYRQKKGQVGGSE